MYNHEDLWIKILDNFHTEITPILKSINPLVQNNFWFEQKSIKGKMMFINNLLLSLNSNEISLTQLIQLKDILNSNRIIFKNYLQDHDIATCFIYFLPENLKTTQQYFNKYSKFFESDMNYLFNVITYFMLPVEWIGFPNDCTFKLTAKANNDISIKRQNEPFFDIEKEKGKVIGNNRTRSEQHQLELQLFDEKKGLYKKGISYAMNKFINYAAKINKENIELFDKFDSSIKLCEVLITKKQNDSAPPNLPELEKLYLVLKNGYIDVLPEEFFNIFQQDYSGEKITWLKPGWELKYLVDRLNEKMNISNKINNWTNKRFILKQPVENLARYLTRQINSDHYQNLMDHNQRSNLLYKYFKG